MENIAPIILAVGSVITATTGLLLVIQQWRMAKNIQKIETQGNSLQSAMQKAMEEKGRSDENMANAVGKSVVGTPTQSQKP